MSGHWPTEGLGLEHISEAMVDLRENSAYVFRDEIDKQILELERKVAAVEASGATADLGDFQQAVAQLHETNSKRWNELATQASRIQTQVEKLLEGQDEKLELELVADIKSNLLDLAKDL